MHCEMLSCLLPWGAGWIGGVHTSVRMMQLHVMYSAKLTSLNPLATGLRYVTLFREPIDRFLSEFYETYDGWETTHSTPPRHSRKDACSAELPNRQLRQRAIHGVDVTTRELYHELFPYWIRCRNNMAANRQTRALAYNGFAEGNGTGGVFARRLCGHLTGGPTDYRCPLHLARHALYQFSFFGLNEARCASEKLFEAQFGLSFANSRATRGKGADMGKGAHRFKAKLSLSQLKPDEQTRVHELTFDDQQLYREAEEVFKKRLQFYGISRDVRCT